MILDAPAAFATSIAGSSIPHSIFSPHLHGPDSPHQLAILADVLSAENDDVDDEDTPWKACPDGTILLMIPGLRGGVNDIGGNENHWLTINGDSTYYIRSEEGKLTMTQLQYDPEDPNGNAPKDFQRQQKLTNNFVALTPVASQK